MSKKYTVTITKLPGSIVEIKGEIAWDALAVYEKKAFERLGAHLELDGFRKGQVPEAVAKSHIGDDLILSDMAELAINEYYPEIMKEEKLDLIGRPNLSITKLARDNALGFTLTATEVPAIILPNYKNIAAAVPNDTEKVVVTPEDVEKVLQELRQLKAYGHVHTEHDKHEHTEELPEVNDEFAKSFGPFNSVDELRAKIKENILTEKDRDALDKRRVQILESLIKETTFDVPELLIKSEQEKMLAQIEAEITRAGMSLDDYLAKSNKTREAVLEEYKGEAEKRARMQLILNSIARDAKLLPTDAEVDAEAQKIMETYPGADLERAKAYADMLLTNEKVLKMLEAEK